MSALTQANPLEVPRPLQEQLRAYQHRVWTIKLVEACGAAIVALLVAYACVFVLDRLWDTPGWVRGIAFLIALTGGALVPWCLHRWIWRHRSLDQLAQLLGRRMPQIGDQLLGIIELARSDTEQRRSRALCAAAIAQVAEDARRRDLNAAVPPARHQLWGTIACGLTAGVIALAVLFPGAAASAWARFLVPWSQSPRYTFTQIKELPDTIVTPHGEAFAFPVELTEETKWQPASASIQIDEQPALNASLTDLRYPFELPPRLNPAMMKVSVGDFYQWIHVEPRLRPELSQVRAEVTLPDYLQRTDRLMRDARGGNISIVRGSQAVFSAVANRELAAGSIDDKAVQPVGDTFRSASLPIEESRTLQFAWRDAAGLAGRQPFSLSIHALEDEPPSITCENLPKQAVVLESELLQFVLRAQDDFGVQRVGLHWRSLEDASLEKPIEGERVLSAGSPVHESMEAQGAFSAASFGIPPQPIELRAWAEDYLPGRPRVYSPPHTLYVLTPEQHAVWMAEQLNKWHRQSLEVRDRELQLYETNKQLRAMSDEELNRPEQRQRIESQASAERTNGKRLASLTAQGEQLIRQAQRNDGIGVAHLEKWAEMLQIMQDISGNRMPSVADLLKQASKAPPASAGGSKMNPQAGQVRAAGDAAPSKPAEGEAPPPVPQVVDQESTQQPSKPGEPGSPSESKNKKGRLGLAVTTLMGSPGESEETPPNQKLPLDEAVTEQEGLLAEFEKISDELTGVLANLEGSTLVKRLKSASREQALIAGRINETVSESFARDPSLLREELREQFSELSELESDGSEKVSTIMDDMEAYFERRRLKRYGDILNEMRTSDVIGGLRQLGNDIPHEQGLSIAQCEYWSDVLDRWAEDLVDPACKGSCPGGKTPDSLPPSIVLEVLQVLEGEVNLREETRVAEQAKGAVDADEHAKEAKRLASSQDVLNGRIKTVIERIEALPNSSEHFGKDLMLLAQVDSVMEEATTILAGPETGDPAIVVETEVIELLLQSKRINPKSGGGGGSTPGGGGTGQTQDSALALIGPGVNEKEVREDRGVTQATGETGTALPAEYRSGLDEYFNRLLQTGEE